MTSMNLPPQNHDDNVVELAIKKKPDPDQPAYCFAKAGTAAKDRGDAAQDDARVKEAMRLAEAFLAIEDATARNALIELAERLVSYDWIRKVK